LVGAGVLMLLGAGSAAAAGNPSGDQYGNVAGKQTKPAKVVKAPLAAPASGQLPFTGIDLAFAAVGGAVLLAGGATLRRVSRKHTRQ
jgi:hypothetical protein